MQHIRDLPVTDNDRAAMSGRARLFTLLQQQTRAAHVGSLTDDGQVIQSDADMDAIRKQAARSFARPE